jgi:hypothetical protein
MRVKPAIVDEAWGSRLIVGLKCGMGYRRLLVYEEALELMCVMVLVTGVLMLMLMLRDGCWIMGRAEDLYNFGI